MVSSVISEPPACVSQVGAVLGEGPLWDPRRARLIWLDIKGEKIFLYDPDGGDTEIIAAPEQISALALAAGGEFLCAGRSGFSRLRLDGENASVRAIANPEAALSRNRFNDGKVDPAGGFWAGSMDDAEEEATGAWWRLRPSGAAEKIDDGYLVTNGPAFDPRRGRVFVTDSARRRIFVADTDGASFENKRDFLQFGDADGYPDGMSVDAEAALWVAFWDGACVRRFSPDGVLLEEVALPAPRPTSVAIVEDMLFVTSAAIGLDADALKAAPLSGGLFLARLTRSLGVAADYFDDRAIPAL